MTTPRPDETSAALAELLAAAHAVFAAIRGRDLAALEALTAESFIVRVPGAPDVDRAGFLAGIAAIPGELVSVEGEHVAARQLGPDAGVVTGYQVARLRLDGAEIVDRAPFADVFERHEGRWRMTFAFGVVPVDAPGTPVDAPAPA